MKIKVIILASLMALGAIASNAGPTRTLTEIQALVDDGWISKLSWSSH